MFAAVERGTAGLIAIVVGLAAIAGLAVFALWFFRSYERIANRALARRFAGLRVFQHPAQGLVQLTYYTYDGVIAWVRQTPHGVCLPPEDARVLLGRLLRYNLTWGLTAFGSVLIVPVALCNYFVQRRSITAQAKANPAMVFPASDGTPAQRD